MICLEPGEDDSGGNNANEEQQAPSSRVAVQTLHVLWKIFTKDFVEWKSNSKWHPSELLGGGCRSDL